MVPLSLGGTKEWCLFLLEAPKNGASFSWRHHSLGASFLEAPLFGSQILLTKIIRIDKVKFVVRATNVLTLHAYF